MAWCFSFLIRIFLRVVLQEGLIIRNLSTSCHFEKQFLVCSVLISRNFVLDQKLAVLLLKQIKPINLLLIVSSKSLICKNELLYRHIFLKFFYLCSLIALNNIFQHLNFLLQCRFIRSSLILRLEIFIILCKIFNFNFLFLNNSLKLLYNLLKLLSSTILLRLKLNCVTSYFVKTITS